MYSIVIAERDVLLGAPPRVELVLQAAEARPAVITFDHSSLVIELATPRGFEPLCWFPNSFTEERENPDGTHDLHRLAKPGGVEPVAAGARVARALDLLESFGAEVLDLGDFKVGYTLMDEERQEIRAAPATFRVRSGPASVDLLLGLLERPDAEVRARAAGLLRRMTARDFGFDAAAAPATQSAARAAWRDWWGGAGKQLAWSFDSDGATFDAPAAPRAPGEPRTSDRLGGIVLPRREWDPKARWALLGVLKRWVESDDPKAHLPGASLVADDTAAYPPPDLFLPADGALLEAWKKVLARLIEEAPARAELAPDVVKVARTLRRSPSAELAPQLSHLANVLPPTSERETAHRELGSLLDAIAPGRVAVGSEGR